MKNFFYKNLPLPLQKIIATVSGRFLMKEKFCLISPPWFAYGLLLATKQAKKYKLRGFTAIEFGVANGRGFKLLNEIKTKLEEIENIDIRLFGFDTLNRKVSLKTKSYWMKSEKKIKFKDQF